MTTELLTPIIEGGIRHVNYFNGRLLTAEDLRDEQEARHIQLRELGQTLGEGVIKGLQVERDPTAGSGGRVTVTPGTALNRKGDLLRLTTKTSLELVPRETQQAVGNGEFIECSPVTSATPTGTGVYVLVISPVSQLQDRAPMIGLKDNGVSKTCGSRYQVEGVQFRLVYIDTQSSMLVPTALRQSIGELLQKDSRSKADRSLLRNLLAHLCFGTVEKQKVARNILGGIGDPTPLQPYGVLDKIRVDSAGDPQSRLQPCDVPLALVFWTKDGIDFVDPWSVRRRLHRRTNSWHSPFPADDRRIAEGEAAYLQFQQQLNDLTGTELNQSELLTAQATDYFRFFPAAGVFPFAAGSGSTGFDYLQFMNGLTIRDPIFIEGHQVVHIFKTSFTYPSLDLTTGEFIWLYLVRENRQTPPTGDVTPQVYMIFTAGYIPFQGEAQYDLSRWNFSNYSPGVASQPIGGSQDGFTS